MDNAIYIPTEELVSAEDLCGWESVDEDGFVCRACYIAVEPVAYKKGMKRRPYFRLYKNTRHQNDCGIDGYEKLVLNAKYNAVSDKDGFPIPYPNKMVIVTSREQVANNRESGSSKDKSVSNGKSQGEDDKNRKKHNRTTTTIRPLARHFIDFPHSNDRNIPLIVEGINCEECNTYSTVFKRISATKIGSNLYPGKRIFYGSVYTAKYNDKPKNINLSNSFIVNLAQGLWVEELGGKRKPEKLYQVIVDYSTWSTKAVNTIKREIEIAKDEYWEAVKEKNSNTKAWLFFIGEQDKDDPFLFYVNNHRCICCLIADNL